MAKRTHFFQKLIKKLNRKLKLMEGEMQTLRTRNMLGQGSSGGMGIGVGIGLGGVAGTGGDAAMNGGLGGSGLALTASSSSMGGFYNTNNSNTITSRGFKQGSSSARLHTTGKFGLSGKSKTNSLTSPSSAHSNSYLKQQYKQLEVKHKNLLKRCKKVLGEKEDKEIELENTRKASYRMLQLQDEAVTFIMACIEDITRNLEDGTLQDVKGPAVRIDTGQPLPGTRPETLNELNNYDKLVVLHMLLNKLDFRNPFTKHPILNLNPLQNTPGNISSGSVHVSSSQEYYQGYIAPHLQQSVDAVDADAQERGMGLGDIEQYNRHASDQQGSSRNEMLQNINHMVERIGESPREFDYYSSSTIKSGNDINDNNQNENETEGSGGDYEDQNDQAINRYDYLARQQLNTPQFGE